MKKVFDKVYISTDDHSKYASTGDSLTGNKLAEC